LAADVFDDMHCFRLEHFGEHGAGRSVKNSGCTMLMYTLNCALLLYKTAVAILDILIHCSLPPYATVSSFRTV